VDFVGEVGEEGVFNAEFLEIEGVGDAG